MTETRSKLKFGGLLYFVVLSKTGVINNWSVSREHLIVLVKRLLGKLNMIFLITLHLFPNVVYLSDRVCIESEYKLSEQVGISDMNMFAGNNMLTHSQIDLVEQLL